MAVVIRLKRVGAPKKTFWRMVVTEALAPREGRSIEELGTYSPMKHPGGLKVKLDRYKYWLSVGAKPTDTIKSLVKQFEKKS